MLAGTFRPLARWPGERCKDRKVAQFRARYDATLDLLEAELAKLKAKEIIIQVDGLTLNDIRNDGWPKGSWWPRGGFVGVIVSFESPKGAISFPCDRYTDWRDNLRAIALALEALRAVDRYGVTRGNEQYKGWLQIEAPRHKMSSEEAADFLASLCEGAPQLRSAEPTFIANLCRALRLQHHPDRAGGSHEIFVKIGQAEDALASEWPGEGGK